MRADAPFAGPLKAIVQMVKKNPSWDFSDLLSVLSEQRLISQKCPYDMSVTGLSVRRAILYSESVLCISALLEDADAGLLVHEHQRCPFPMASPEFPLQP